MTGKGSFISSFSGIGFLLWTFFCLAWGEGEAGSGSFSIFMILITFSTACALKWVIIPKKALWCFILTVPKPSDYSLAYILGPRPFSKTLLTIGILIDGSSTLTFSGFFKGDSAFLVTTSSLSRSPS